MALDAVKIIGGNPTVARVENDFYPTPRGVILALLCAEFGKIPCQILEPACGDGALSKAMSENGYSVTSADLIYRGYGVGGVDFLKRQEQWDGGIITNPPFTLAQEFIEKGFEIGCTYLALILKSTYWHAYSTRGRTFRRYPPAAIYALGWRPDFLGLKAPTMDVIWCVWRKDHNGPTTYDVLPKP
ncbi:hypothetical protein UFOVP1299_12 [uncultured Caudovirales phage]|uniref:AdoMet_MTases domain containing protein n=1 Tax=uncultured Caudovirales phage TaxID=2100421 RepID=A0A6J5REH9_9CAUD|nr:hypothetical protein UFOVP1299_12 [uncultured Caudovirales phage]